MKVVVFDLDGTFINGHNEVIGGEKTLSLLSKLQELHFQLAICTGRLDHDIVYINEKYHLNINERISQNGAVLYRETYQEALLLSKESALRIYDILKDFHVRVEMNTISNRYWHSPRDPEFPKEFYDSSIIKKDFSTVIPYQPVVLFLVTGEYSLLKQIQKLIQEQIEGVQAIFTSQTSLEIVPSQVSKGYALKRLYADDEVYAIGDSESDLSMKEEAYKFYYIGDTHDNVTHVKDISEALNLILEENL